MAVVVVRELRRYAGLLGKPLSRSSRMVQMMRMEAATTMTTYVPRVCLPPLPRVLVVEKLPP